MNIQRRMSISRCNWLSDYLKEKIERGDLKTYNRIKKVVYYFPSIIDGLTKENFDMAVKHPDDSYICIGANDYAFRYKEFDEFYKRKNGSPFEPQGSFESRYLSLKDIYDYFGV